LTLKLAAIETEIEDEFIGVTMLNGLGDKYVPMIMAMESSGTRISSDYIRSMLIQQDTKLCTKENDRQDKARIAQIQTVERRTTTRVRQLKKWPSDMVLYEATSTQMTEPKTIQEASSIP
jgi:predicted nucleotidyltransferase